MATEHTTDSDVRMLAVALRALLAEHHAANKGFVDHEINESELLEDLDALIEALE